ncbi:ureidoglycolate lyase [Piscinibacter sp.]|jgi:ureidoglycolate lyase|uniref:ureidoglycolate lyase n=1 Tax=Piscinibacter sp. TaxID=1903157 RepID=UPI0035593BF9
MSTHRHIVPIEPLDAGAFRRYGDVIEASDSAEHFTVDQGAATRYHDLAKVDVAAERGHPVISIFRAQPCRLPLHLRLFERHPIGSQAFVPMQDQPYLVLVAAADTPLHAQHIRCFRASPGQGVNFARGTWHHPVLPLHSVCDFLVIDRGGPARLPNCEEGSVDELELWIQA